MSNPWRNGVAFLLLAAAFLLVSCPNPINSSLLNLIEDSIAPDLSVTTPLTNTNYKGTIHVVGTLSDSALKAGDLQGELGILQVSVLSNPLLNQAATFEADGSYTVSPAGASLTIAGGDFALDIDATYLRGPQTITLTARDRNSNTATSTLVLFEDLTGPYLQLSTPVNGSVYGLIVNLAGTVKNSSAADAGTDYLKQLYWQVPGTDRTGTLDVRPGSLDEQPDGAFLDHIKGTFAFDPATGAFSDVFNTVGLYNNLGLRVVATDMGDHNTELVLTLLSDNRGPDISATCPGYYSSATTQTITVAGTVTNYEYLANDRMSIIVADTVPKVSGYITSFTPDGTDPTLGHFSYTFNIKAVPASGLVGTLTVTLSAKDEGNRDSDETLKIYDDPVGPLISGSSLEANNGYLEITFDGPVYGTSSGSGPVDKSDFQVTFQPNGGASLSSAWTLTDTSGNLLSGGESAVRLNLAPAYVGTVTGYETIEVKPASNAVFDAIGNPSATTQTTGTVRLNDRVSAVAQSVTSAKADGAYKAGEVIDVTVQFSEPVIVTGAPRLWMETGAADQPAPYQAPVASNVVTFRYTVQAGDNSPDLVYTSSAVIDLNGGTIKDATGNDADPSLPSPGAAGSLNANKALVIDTTSPTVTSVSASTADGYYNATDVIDVTVQFSEPVTVTGTPTLTLETGATDRNATYNSGTGTSTLVFRYTVQASDASADLDYVATTSLALAGGTIRDAATNNATLTLPTPGAAGSLGFNKDLVIDNTAPTVSSVSSTTADGTYGSGAVIDITVTFSENVTVNTGGGTPTLALETGTTDHSASYSSGSDGTVLTFQYTVQDGDVSADLNYKATTSLALAGGTIRDAAGNNATLTLPALAAVGSLGFNKDLVIDGVAPTVSSVTSTAANGTYGIGSVIDITVTFGEAVTVDTGGGTPTLTLETGTTDHSASYVSGSGGTVLTFQYTVQAGDVSADLNYTGTGALAANGGTLQDALGNDATLTLPATGSGSSLGGSKALVIDGVAPTVSSVGSGASNGTFNLGDTINITVTFSEAVTVDTGGGTPTLTLETGTTDHSASYVSGSGGTVLTFQYTVQSGDTSADLDYVATTSLALNSGTIRDAAGNNATLTLPAPGAAGSLGASKNLVIDGVAPTVSAVSASNADGAFKIADQINVTVTFTENVTVTGTPTLTLETGATDRNAAYNSGTGTSTLVFRYTVQSGDTSADLDYVGTNSLALAGGTIRDAATNNAVLDLPAPGAPGSLGANKALVIDGMAPAVTNVTSPNADGTYGLAAVIDITVQFDENVTVTGTPVLTLETGSPDRDAVYQSGTGTSTLTFRYTVQSGDTSADLDYKATTSLALSGGTIKDAAGNNATLTLPAPAAVGSLGYNKAIVVSP